MSRWVGAVTGVLLLVVVLVLIVVLGRPDDGPAVTQPPVITGPATTPSVTLTPLPPARPTPTPRPTRTPCPPPAAPTRVRVLTFNIHGGFGGGYRLAGIGEEIAATGADIVLLQEVDRHRDRSRRDDQASLLAARLGLQEVYGVNVVRAGDPGNARQEYGTAILSRYPILSWSNRLLPRYAGQEQRGLLEAVVQLPDQQIHVYNTHLQHTGGNIRVVQMKAVRAMIGDDPVPHLLGGDFNAAPDRPPLAVATSGDLADSWPGVGSGAGRTVPEGNPHRRIDYVLSSPQFSAKRAEVIPSAISDHRAVRVALDVSAAPTC